MLDTFVKVNEAARILGVHPKTLRDWDNSGKFKARRHPINRYRVYLKKDLEDLNNSLLEG